MGDGDQTHTDRKGGDVVKVYGRAVNRGRGWAYVEGVGALIVPEGVSNRDLKRIAKGAVKCKSRLLARMQEREDWADTFAR